MVMILIIRPIRPSVAKIQFKKKAGCFIKERDDFLFIMFSFCLDANVLYIRLMYDYRNFNMNNACIFW
jgi:hypothetical protein